MKGFLFAGLPKSDPRVAAAFDWLRKNWTLEENPGFADVQPIWSALFYPTIAATLVGRPDGWQDVVDPALVEIVRETKQSCIAGHLITRKQTTEETDGDLEVLDGDVLVE